MDVMCAYLIAHVSAHISVLECGRGSAGICKAIGTGAAGAARAAPLSPLIFFWWLYICVMPVRAADQADTRHAS